jgi:hypothetical protein
LSYEQFRGPLTINLSEPFVLFQALQNGQPALTGDSRLQIPAAHLDVWVAPEVVWHIPPADLLKAAPVAHKLERCASLAVRLIAEKGNIGFSPILHDLLYLAGSVAESQIAPASLSAPLLSLAQRLPASLQERDLASVVEIMAAFLGCGRGLTPSGDDFVMGLLLMLNRWQSYGWSGSLLAALNAQVTAAARQRTTSLSAALLACAARGEADERLIDAVDYLCADQGDGAGQAAGLAGWGASSGLDALAGMALAIIQ